MKVLLLFYWLLLTCVSQKMFILFQMRGSLTYYDLRRTLPFLVLFMSHLVRKPLPIRKCVYAGAFALTSLFFIPLDVLPIPWGGFPSLVEYVLFGLVFFEVFNRKLKNQLQAFAYSLMMLPAIGYMYELPIMAMHTYSFELYPFVVRSVLIYIAILVWRIGFKTFLSWKVGLALFSLILFDIWYLLNPLQLVIFTRLPTMFFWLIVVSHMEEEQT